MEVNTGEYLLSRDRNRKIVWFCQYTEKWSEIKLLTRDFVSSAAQRWIVLANLFRTNQSARAKSTIYLRCIYELLIMVTWRTRVGQFDREGPSKINKLPGKASDCWAGGQELRDDFVSLWLNHVGKKFFLLEDIKHSLKQIWIFYTRSTWPFVTSAPVNPHHTTLGK